MKGQLHGLDITALGIFNLFRCTTACKKCMYIPLLVGVVPLLVGDVPLLVGDVPLLVGDVPLLVGDVPLLVGDVPFTRPQAEEMNEAPMEC